MHYLSSLTNNLATQANELGFFDKVISIVKDYYPNILEGVGNTLLIALIGTIIGLAIGILTGLIRTIPTSKNPVIKCLQKVINAIISVYVEIFRGTPMMVQSMVIFWGFAGITGGNTLQVIPAGIIIVSINTGAYMVEIVRGGIIVVSKNARLFIPASHATASRNDKLEDLLKKTVKFKVLEVNKQRRRAVGSIRAVLKEERKAAEEKFWAEAQEGEVRKGVVKSLMKFGAFVDIGGVDGMIHVSELSWNRIKDPSEVVSVGDEVEVTIKSLNPEKKQIALGYKKLEDNPWEIFKSKYEVGSEAEVEIANFTDFGAFAHIIAGVDGLIHISQIANKHVAKPADVLKIGEKVNVKITDIDEDRKRVSLSIRALLPEEAPAEAEEAAEEETATEE